MSFTKEWALKWIEGSVVSYIAGKTPLNIVLGRIKKALKSYDVTLDEVKALVNSVINNPVYLLHVDPDVKKARAEELLKTLERV